MIIIALYQNGVAEIVSPSRIFQGTDSEQIVVLSPYPYTVPLQISYTSPKGVNNGYVPMQPIDLPSDYTTVSAWQYSPGSSWTQTYGTAYINLLVNLPTETSGTYGQLTTFMCQITIEQSILPTLPPTPTQDVYDQILEYLGAYADLNERINKLEQAEVTGVKGAAETTFRTGDVNITPANIGLGNVDNTSDQDKPVSTAQQEALNALQQEVESYADTAAENAQSAAVNTANEYTYRQISSLQTTLEDYTDTQVASGVTEAVQQAKEYTDDQFGIKVGTTVTVGGLAQATVDLDTAMVGGVIPTQLTNQNIDTFVGENYWGKVFYIPGGSSVIGLPPNVNGGALEVLRGGGQTTIHRYTATTDSSGESIAPNMLQRQYISSWSNWEEVVSADGNYPTLGAGKSEILTEPFTVGKDTTAATTGYVKFASVSLPAAYRSASARFEVLDKNPVNAQTNMCGVEVIVRNISETNVTVIANLLYGSSAYLSKIYACVKKGVYPVVVDLYFDITSSNPQESISCIKPLFTFTRTTGSTTFTFISDNVSVLDLPTDTTNIQLSTVYTPVTEAERANNDGAGNNIIDTYAQQNGNYPTLGAGYLAKNLEVVNGSLNNQYYKLCTYTSPKVANSSSFIFLINGIYGDQATAFAAESGLLEFDIRSSPDGVYESLTGLTILSGNLKPEDFFIVVSDDLSSVSLYTHLYQQFGTLCITQIDGDREHPVVFDGTRYATLPDGAVYAVLRNNASNATTVNGVNVYTSVSQLGLSGSYTDEDVVNAMSVPSIFIGYSTSINGYGTSVNIYKFSTGSRNFLALCNNFAWASTFTLQQEFNWNIADTKYDDTVVVTENPVNITSILYPNNRIANWRLTFSDYVRITVPETSDTNNCTPLMFAGFNVNENCSIEGHAITSTSQPSITIAAGQTLNVMGYYNSSGNWVLKLHCPDYFSVLENAGSFAFGLFGECRNPYSYKISAVVPENETSANVTVYIKQVS